MEEKIAQILSQILGTEIHVGDNVSAQNTPKWDSLKSIEIIMTLEEEFDISFNPSDIPQLKSMDAIVKKVKELQC